METPKELYRLPPILPRELCSDHVQHLVCRLHGGVGHIWAIRPYPGVVALAADFAMPCFSLPYMEQYPAAWRECGVALLDIRQRLAVRAEQRLTADLAVHIPIETLAAELGVSTSALKKYFGQVYGKPISRYLREKRIAQAKRLLVGTSQTVGAIALATGYQNQSKFGAVFRDATGATPSEYRRLHRAAHPSKGEETT